MPADVSGLQRPGYLRGNIALFDRSGRWRIMAPGAKVMASMCSHCHEMSTICGFANL